MIANHHRPDLNDLQHKTSILLYFAELVDEMISPMPYRMRFNFSPEQIKKLGERFGRRNGLVNVLLALIKLHKGKGFAWQIVNSLVSLFSMDELLVEGYEEKLQLILDFCPFNCAVASPTPAATPCRARSIATTAPTRNSSASTWARSTSKSTSVRQDPLFPQVRHPHRTSAHLNKSGREESEEERSKVNKPKPKPGSPETGQ